jgi:pimeloyl-ACP methyl ester carboxylesterase
MSAYPPSPVLVHANDDVDLSVLTWNLGGSKRPALLVHGLASNATLWSGVADWLVSEDHPVAAVDLRGHGHSSKPEVGYDFATIGSDLLGVLSHLGWIAAEPVVAGQSWGANVVLDFAAHHRSALAGLVLVDGGTIELSARFADWPTCKAALTPPNLLGVQYSAFEAMVRSHHPDWPESGIAGTVANMEVLQDSTIRPWLSLEHHLQILRNLWEHRPSELYRLISCPVTLLVADDPTNTRWMAGKRREVALAAAGIADCDVQWIRGDHDLHAQFPQAVAKLISDTPERTSLGTAKNIAPVDPSLAMDASQDRQASPGANS